MNLRHQLLVAMPTMSDPRFHQAVVYLCEYDQKGAMGLVINKPLQLSLADVLRHLQIDVENSRLDDYPVLQGGPIAEEQGFILHCDPSQPQEEQVIISSSKQDLINIARGKGQEDSLVCLGYCGWGAGQLELELKDNAWLIAPAATQLLFKTAFEGRWRSAAQLVGVDFGRLAGDVGHA